METRYRIGQLVRLRADPSRSGPITEVLSPTGGIPRYRVFHSATDIGEYHQDQLVAVDAPTIATADADAMVAGKWLDVDIFRARLTASRLAHPLVDSLYALRAARIHHIPFQFKPILRLLRADRPRLLIADEVGVGKTIEAGLILKELQTRQHVENVLVVCPKALVLKWRSEMRRFDEDFRPLNGDALRYCLRETHLDGAWPAQYSRAIVPLELLRMDEHLFGVSDGKSRRGLLTLSPPPGFSVTIVDEAHHLRNPGTNSHELARFLCDVSEAVLFLSATPVHLGSVNLHTLLNLLRPDLFPDQAVFQQMVEPNAHITQAVRHVRNCSPPNAWQAKASSALTMAAQTVWGESVVASDPRFGRWATRLTERKTLSDSDRVACVRDLEELHSLAHVMNRTRRRDIARFTIREPRTVAVVPFTPEQQRFYDALVAFRLDVLSLHYDPRVARLVINTLERQAASCLPGVVPTLERFIRERRVSDDELSDGSEGDDSFLELPSDLIRRAQELRKLADALPSDDPKLDQLHVIIGQALAEGRPGKILLFSFFLQTLDYLEANLRAAGYRVGLVTGRVPDEERETLRERFRLPTENEEAIDVLLSSEVGCEGLDYEFCDRLVNYDIPWNPMRIEQRIGRIDRFGQAADKVLIFNFITPGTVEERVFFRCFDRLGIFKDTVGDLEEVLGNVVEDLTRVALDPSLNPAQAEEKTRQTADNAIRIVDEQRRLEDEGASLLGLDAFVEDVESLSAEGRFVAPEELKLMIQKFVELPEFGGRMTRDERQPGMYRLRLSKEGRAALLTRARALNLTDRPTVSFVRWLEGNEPHLLLTFEQETALEHRDVPFVTPAHPLARSAISHWARSTEPLVSHISVADGSTPAGRYIFICQLWEALGLKQELRLACFAWDVDRSCHSPETSSELVRLLVRSQAPREPAAIPADTVRDVMESLDEEAFRARLSALTDLHERNAALVARKLGSLDAYHTSRRERVEAELSRASDARIARMKEAERDRIEQDYAAQWAEIDKRREADIVSRRVAAGILVIE
jgi:ATP-dependent helicase HepA